MKEPAAVQPWYLALLLLLTSACQAAAPVQQSDLTTTELRFVTANAEFTLLQRAIC